MKHQIHVLIDLLRNGMIGKEKIMTITLTCMHIVVMSMSLSRIVQLKNIAGTAITVVVMGNQY